MPDDSQWPDAEEDARFIEEARRGNLSSFNWLVLRHQTRVYNLCYRILSDPDAAADATQEAFISAYRAIGNFKSGHFRAWLMRIASNACLDALRSEKRRQTRSIERGGPLETTDEETEPLQIADSDVYADPEGRVLAAEVAHLVQLGLNSLPDDQRIALVLVDVQGFSYDEAADITGANLGTVKSRINRGRSKMRDYLRGVGIVPPGRELSEEGVRSLTEE